MEMSLATSSVLGQTRVGLRQVCSWSFLKTLPNGRRDQAVTEWEFEEILESLKHYWVITTSLFVPLRRHYHEMKGRILELIAHNLHIRELFSDGMVENVRMVCAENHLMKLGLWLQISFQDLVGGLLQQALPGAAK